jgi:hypothetical protein
MASAKRSATGASSDLRRKRHLPRLTSVVLAGTIVTVWAYFSIRPVSAIVIALAGNTERLTTMPPIVLMIWIILSISFFGGAMVFALFNRWFLKFERHVQTARPGAVTIISLGPTPAALRWSLHYQQLHRQRCVLAVSADCLEIWTSASSPHPTRSISADEIAKVTAAQPRPWHGPQPLLFHLSDGSTSFFLPRERRWSVVSSVNVSGLQVLRDRVLQGLLHG